MRILLIGSGGREHALAWKLSQSPKCDALFCLPGNPGIAEFATCAGIAADDIEGIVKFARAQEIDFAVVGPEGPLVLGLADRLRDHEIAVFGPSQMAARLEGSKAFMKDLCAKYGIPTAAYGRFTNPVDAEIFIRKMNAPIVVKADGLAAGKGVVIAKSHSEALAAMQGMLSGSDFGDAGREVVIEEFLEGEEVSFFALADGVSVMPLTSAQDHKRVGEGDVGLNTGGMGAFSPVYLMDDHLQAQVMADILQPLVKGMEKDGFPFTGVLFAGLMIKDGRAKVLEYNARFGDPECQVIMSLLDSDLVDLLHACATGNLDRARMDVRWKDGAALCVVMAAQGYPGTPVKGTVIRGLEKADKVEGVKVFHAGTARNDKGEVVAAGGRVLGVTAQGASVSEAQARAYDAIKKIEWPEGFYRRDIGFRAVAAEKAA